MRIRLLRDLSAALTVVDLLEGSVGLWGSGSVQVSPRLQSPQVQRGVPVFACREERTRRDPTRPQQTERLSASLFQNQILLLSAVVSRRVMMNRAERRQRFDKFG